MLGTQPWHARKTSTPHVLAWPGVQGLGGERVGRVDANTHAQRAGGGARLGPLDPPPPHRGVRLLCVTLDPLCVKCTRARVCVYVCMGVCVYMGVCVHGCVCVCAWV